jgi:hypothetical protein
MNLVDTDWGVQGVAGPTGPHPIGITPLVIEVPHLGSRLRRCLVMKAKRVGFLRDEITVADPVLVGGGRAYPGHKALPDP